MREVQKRQLQFGQIPVDKVWLDPKSRDDIPAVLKGLQHLYKEKQEELFRLLEKHILPGTHRGVGRPGMEMWRILVLGVLKQGLGCDFDRLHNLANHHETVRAMLGHSEFADKTHYELQTIVDNVSLMRPELLVEVGRLVVESGHAVARKKPGERLRGRCDSFVVETDVHYPTDLGLLWDGVRCLIRETARAAVAHGVGGWRQHRHLGKRVKEGFNPVRSARRGKQTPEKVEAYLGLCRDLVERAEETVKALVEKGVGEAECRLIRGYIDHARRQIGQVDRRLLQGERIPHQEKVFSIFEPHTRWISKGKAGRRWNWEWRLRGRGSTSSSSITSCCGRKTTWRSRSDGRGDPSAVPRSSDVQLRPGLSQSEQPHPTRRQARVERAARQGTTQPRRPRAGRSRGSRP